MANKPSRLAPRHVPKFRVQKRVEIRAKDAKNNPFVVGTYWDTLAQAPTQPAAEQLYKQWIKSPGRYRLVEDRPYSMGVRVILPARERHA